MGGISADDTPSAATGLAAAHAHSDDSSSAAAGPKTWRRGGVKLTAGDAMRIFQAKRASNKDHATAANLARLYDIAPKTVRAIWNVQARCNDTAALWTSDDERAYLKDRRCEPCGKAGVECLADTCRGCRVQKGVLVARAKGKQADADPHPPIPSVLPCVWTTPSTSGSPPISDAGENFLRAALSIPLGHVAVENAQSFAAMIRSNKPANDDADEIADMVLRNGQPRHLDGSTDVLVCHACQPIHELWSNQDILKVHKAAADAGLNKLPVVGTGVRLSIL